MDDIKWKIMEIRWILISKIWLKKWGPTSPPCLLSSMPSCLLPSLGPSECWCPWCTYTCTCTCRYSRLGLCCSKEYSHPLHFLLCQFNWGFPTFSYSKDLEFEHIHGLTKLFAMWIMSITILLEVCLKNLLWC